MIWDCDPISTVVSYFHINHYPQITHLIIDDEIYATSNPCCPDPKLCLCHPLTCGIGTCASHGGISSGKGLDFGLDQKRRAHDEASGFQGNNIMIMPLN